MSASAIRSWLWPTLMLLITAMVCSTAIRIEWYNHAAGGYLPRPQGSSMEGNDVAWRTTSPDMAEQNYRRSIAMGRGVEIDDKRLATMPLSDTEKRELDRIRLEAVTNTEFRSLVASMGCLQYALVPFGLIISIAAVRVPSLWLRSLGVVCLAINLIAGALMLYRQYYPSLGW